LVANLSTDDYIDPEELAEIVMEEIEETADDLEKDGIVESSYRHGFKLTNDWQTKLEENDA
jgi:lipoate-protein ligase A